MSDTYRLLLRTPGAAAFFLTAAAGRVGIAMTSLGIVWLVHTQTGSYTVAGAVTGAFAIAEGTVGPQAARLVDRFGQTRVLPPLLGVHSVAVAALLVCTRSGAPVAALVVCGAAMGASIPQLGALSAARWAALVRRLERPEWLVSAFSLESLSNATAFLVGPVLVSVAGAAGHPASASAAAAGLVVAGGLLLARQHVTAPPVVVAGRQGRPARSLLGVMFLLLLAVNVAIGVYFGALQISVVAFATEQGSAGSAAALYAASSLAGLVGGWLFGLRTWRPRVPAQLVIATVGLTLAACLAAALATAAGSLLGVAAALGLAGLAVPPILVLTALLTEQHVDQAVLTQAFTWLNSASAAGSAAAAAVAGLAVDHFHARGGFGLAGVAALTMALLAGVIATTPAGSRTTTSGRADTSQ